MWIHKGLMETSGKVCAAEALLGVSFGSIGCVSAVWSTRSFDGLVGSISRLLFDSCIRRSGFGKAEKERNGALVVGQYCYSGGH